MKVYLDTSHLQKWCQKTLDKPVISILNKLKDAGNCTFVLSNIHIQEIINRNSKSSCQRYETDILNLLDFLDSLPKIWIRNPPALYQIEIKNSFEEFSGKHNGKLSPFVDDFVDTLDPSSSPSGDPYILENRIYNRGKKLSEIFKKNYSVSIKTKFDNNEMIAAWGISQNESYEYLKKHQKELKRKKLFKKILESLIKNIYPNLKDINLFCEYLLSKPHLIPSNYISFYLQHILHANTRQKMKPGDLPDITHLHALPYVDHLSCDKRNFGQLQTFIKKLSFKCGILTTDLHDLSATGSALDN